MLEIKKLDNDSKRQIKEFVRFAWEHYKGCGNWVPPLFSDQVNQMMGKNNPLFDTGFHSFFMAYRDGKAVGRVLCGADKKFNDFVNKKQGYFALFECIDDQETANALFDSCKQYFIENGMDTFIGPVSPTNGDDSKGVLVMGFDGPPLLLNTYNYEYYEKLYLEYGFEKDEDHLAFKFSAELLASSGRYGETVDKVAQRYGMRADRLDLQQLDREAQDIYTILLEGMPNDWEYTSPKTLQDVVDEIKNLKQFYTGKFVFILRQGERPIGFVVALPDYNIVLKKMNGKLFPLGWLKFLIYRNKIDRIRGLIQFVIKEYQGKGANAIMFKAVQDDFNASNMTMAEGSTIGEYNAASIKTLTRAGGEHYRTYRVYRMNV